MRLGVTKISRESRPMGSRRTVRTGWARARNDCRCEHRRSNRVLPPRCLVVLVVVVGRVAVWPPHWRLWWSNQDLKVDQEAAWSSTGMLQAKTISTLYVYFNIGRHRRRQYRDDIDTYPSVEASTSCQTPDLTSDLTSRACPLWTLLIMKSKD